MSLKKKYSTTKPECKVTFRLEKAFAKDFNDVCLVGDFNSWTVDEHPMKKLKSGDFTVTINLERDKNYQFKYLADKAKWLNDSEPDSLIENEFSGQNSMLTV